MQTLVDLLTDSAAFLRARDGNQNIIDACEMAIQQGNRLLHPDQYDDELLPFEREEAEETWQESAQETLAIARQEEELLIDQATPHTAMIPWQEDMAS